MKTANINNEDELEKKAMVKTKKREIKNKGKMKVSGAGVKQILRIKKSHNA